MTGEDAAFLRAIMAAPEEARSKLVYADWLDEHGRAEEAAFLRAEFGPELSPGGAWPGLDPGWRAYMDTLARPFRPHGNENWLVEVPAENVPFIDRLGRRGRVVTFEPHFRAASAWDDSICDQLQLLTDWMPGTCYYGAATPDVVPFMCEASAGGRGRQDVLAALRPRRFDSARGDSIHQSFPAQFIFDHDESGPQDGDHGYLCGLISGRPWYVVLHPDGPGEVANYVVLLAVGPVKAGSRLLGVVTSQVCHNLCH